MPRSDAASIDDSSSMRTFLSSEPVADSSRLRGECEGDQVVYSAVSH